MNVQYHCDYCDAGFTEDLKEYVKEHEDCCISNPKNKTCHTCEHRKLSMIKENGYHCKLNENTKKHFEHVNKENCNKWYTSNNQILRKLKLSKINENL